MFRLSWLDSNPVRAHKKAPKNSLAPHWASQWLIRNLLHGRHQTQVYSPAVRLSYLSHVLPGCLRFPWRTSSGPVSFYRCCRSWWCWDTLHLSPSSSGGQRERESGGGRNTFEIFAELSVRSKMTVCFSLTHLSHLLVVVVSEVQIICWIDFILTAVAAWKKWWKHVAVILWCSYVIQFLRSTGWGWGLVK